MGGHFLCETITGMLNPVEQIGEIVKYFGRVYMVDTMSSFGGIPMDMHSIGADFLISSANKCVQGVPGFGFATARCEEIARLKSRGFVIYPGTGTSMDTFRIGSIGDVDSDDIQRLPGAVRESIHWPQAIQR